MKNLMLSKINNQKGVTLVELLIAMVIGLFILSGVVTVMGQSKDKFLLEQELALIQENARFIVDELAFEIRMAGYTGCNAAGEFSNSLRNVDDDDWMFDVDGLRGYESEAANQLPEFAGDDAVKDQTDVIVFGRGDIDDSVRVEKHSANAATIHLTAPKTYTEGDILLMFSPNCENSAVFQVTGPSGSSNSQLNHAQSNSMTPGNCTKILRGYSDCTNPPAQGNTAKSYPSGSSIMQFKSAAYFIRDSEITGLPTLYRQALVNKNNALTTEAQEMLSGVEDMQILYSAPDPADPAQYRYYNADEIEDGGIEWITVESVRVELTMVSTRQIFDADDNANPPEDGFLRKNIVVSGKIRNRI